jgi:hypothetical protein
VRSEREPPSQLEELHTSRALYHPANQLTRANPIRAPANINQAELMRRKTNEIAKADLYARIARLAEERNTTVPAVIETLKTER